MVHVQTNIFDFFQIQNTVYKNFLVHDFSSKDLDDSFQ
jgi:hypothetical protein